MAIISLDDVVVEDVVVVFVILAAVATPMKNNTMIATIDDVIVKEWKSNKVESEYNITCHVYLYYFVVFLTALLTNMFVN
jgi:hypothetical protein